MRYVNVFALLMGLSLFGCSSEDDASRLPTPPTTSTAINAAAPSPMGTPMPACEPLYPDAGFPVMVGRAGDLACVIWKGSSGAAQILIKHGAYLPADSPAFEMLYSAPVGSPFTFPRLALPPFRGNDRCFDSESPFTVEVQDRQGNRLGAESWKTCGRLISLADGCSTWPGSADLTALTTLKTAAGEEQVCIMWPDRLSDETAFRITLRYPNSGEEFVYEAPPNTVEFLPPEADTANMGSITAGLGRKDWSLEIVAITPRGIVPVGGQAVTVG